MTTNSPLLQALTSSGAEQYVPVPDVPDAPQKSSSTGSEPLDDKQVRAFNKSPEGRKVVAWVQESYRKAKNARRVYERQWYMNLAFYSGKQYVEWSTNEDRLISQPVTSLHTPRLTVNKIQPIIRTEQSKLTGQKPSATVMPASNDDTDIFAATAGEQVWESLYARLNFQNKLSRSTFWLSICGTSYIKTFWDAGMYDSTSGLYGDINWLPLSPWHILVPDLIEPDLETQAWVMDIQNRLPEEVEALYGDMFPKGVKPNVVATNEILAAAGIGVNSNNQPDAVLIQEVWIKPNMVKCLPEGGMVTVIDDTIVEAAIHGIPYDHKEFPFAKLEHIPSGKYYGVSTIEALIPLQREYNRTQSQIVEAKNRSSKPQFYYRDGSLDVSKITSEPGLGIPVKGTSEFPQAVQLSELPSYVVQFNERMQNDFENISGQHAPTRGEAPSGMAATAIAYLQEQDDSYLATTFQSIEQAIEKTARQSLILAVTYWTVPRLVKATGEDGGYDAMMLRGAQIASSTDIRIEHGSALPTSKSAKQAQVTDWMKMGWIDPNEGFELLDMPMLQQWVNRRKVDKKAAQIENITFRQASPDMVEQAQAQYEAEQQAGMPSTLNQNTGAPLGPPPLVPVNVWDDHAIHIQIHNLWRKSPSYRFVDDTIKAEVEKHVQTHLLALQGTMPQPTLPAVPGVGGTGPDMVQAGIGSAIDNTQAPATAGADQTQFAPPQ